MSQAGFATELARAAKDEWLSVAMETSGFAAWPAYEAVLANVDFLFLDIKSNDPERHRSQTGVTNEVILENAPRMAEFMRRKGGRMVVRIPVVPGLTDVSDVEEIALFVRAKVPGVETLELMPYHRLGRSKYRDIGRPYELQDLQPPTEAQMEEYRAIVATHGLALRYS